MLNLGKISLLYNAASDEFLVFKNGLLDKEWNPESLGTQLYDRLKQGEFIIDEDVDEKQRYIDKSIRKLETDRNFHIAFGCAVVVAVAQTLGSARSHHTVEKNAVFIVDDAQVQMKRSTYNSILPIGSGLSLLYNAASDEFLVFKNGLLDKEWNRWHIRSVAS